VAPKWRLPKPGSRTTLHPKPNAESLISLRQQIGIGQPPTNPAIHQRRRHGWAAAAWHPPAGWGNPGWCARANLWLTCPTPSYQGVGKEREAEGAGKGPASNTPRVLDVIVSVAFPPCNISLQWKAHPADHGAESLLQMRQDWLLGTMQLRQQPPDTNKQAKIKVLQSRPNGTATNVTSIISTHI